VPPLEHLTALRSVVGRVAGPAHLATLAGTGGALQAMQPGGASGAGSSSADPLTVLAEAALSGGGDHVSNALPHPHATWHSERTTAGVAAHHFEPPVELRSRAKARTRVMQRGPRGDGAERGPTRRTAAATS